MTRRCIQGIIRDLQFDTSDAAVETPSKKQNDKRPNLWQEIENFVKIADVPDNQKAALHSCREIGNIGAHPEDDIVKIIPVNVDEADALLKFVEYLIKEYYIDPFEKDNTISSVVSINNEKQKLKNQP